MCQSPEIGHRCNETTVHVERVIAYWSRSLKPAEQNYSPTEQEALALNDGLINFQAFIEGERVIAVTDHAALTWSKTYQNVNHQLLTWGTVFNASQVESIRMSTQFLDFEGACQSRKALHKI